MSTARALPLFVVIALYAAVGPSLPLAAAMAVIALLPLLLRWRLRIGATAQVLAGLTLLGAATALFATSLPSRPAEASLPTPWAAFAGAALLVCLARPFLAEPIGGAPLSLAMQLVALTAAGGSGSGSLYPAAAVAFLLCALWSRRAADDTHAPLGSLLVPRRRALGAMAVVWAGVALACAHALPRANAWVTRMVLTQAPQAVGFSERLWLGSMRDLLASSRAVMRVHGETDYLRGAVFSRYDRGRWTRVAGEPSPVASAARPSGRGAVEIERLQLDAPRYFLPLDAGALAVSSGAVLIDRFGILSPIEADPARWLWFRVGAAPSGPAPPQPQDLQIPAGLAADLDRLARTWTAGAGGDRARLAALQAELARGYAYSLRFDRSGARDPVIEFLLHDKRGHCEYFASAMALLARALGVPARVVTGYRVVERNPLGGYYLVRERNAHAWVEAWVAGRWRTVDPTPAAAFADDAQTPWLGALLDLGAERWSHLLRWFDRTTVGLGLGAALAAALAVIGASWLRRRKRALALDRPSPGEPRPCFRKLSRALDEHGLRRAKHETIEQLARRLDTSHWRGDLAAEGARLLREYAALRYGGHGDEQQLARRIDDYLARLAPSGWRHC